VKTSLPTIQGVSVIRSTSVILQDYRNDLDALRNVLLATPSGAQIPLGEVAKVELSPGPSMIRDEDAQLTGYVYIDLSTADLRIVRRPGFSVFSIRKLRLPSGLHPEVVGRV